MGGFLYPPLLLWLPVWVPGSSSVTEVSPAQVRVTLLPPGGAPQAASRWLLPALPGLGFALAGLGQGETGDYLQGD